MKIVYLSSSTIPSKTANSIHVMKMSQAFSDNGHDVILYGKIPAISGELPKDIYNYYGVQKRFKLKRLGNRLSIRYFGELFYSYRVIRDLKKEKLPDLFYGRNLWSLLLATQFNIPIIYESHALPLSNIRKYFEKKLLKNVNLKKLVVISNALKEEYLTLFTFLRDDAIEVAHDGADIPLVIYKENKCGKDKKNIKVGYVGHLYSGRGIDMIIELAEIFNNVEFHVVGGMEEDIRFWKEKAINIKNIIFHGFIPNGKLHERYQEFDIMLAPYQSKVSVSGGKGDTSRWMSPLKIFEYMAFGKAMIVSDIPVLREVLDDNQNCMLCPPIDINCWEEKLRNLIEDENIRKELGRNAYEKFVNEYTWKIRAKNVIN